MAGLEVRRKLTVAHLNMNYSFMEPVHTGENLNILKGDVNFITFFKYDEHFHHFRCYFDASYKAIMWHIWKWNRIYHRYNFS